MIMLACIISVLVYYALLCLAHLEPGCREGWLSLPVFHPHHGFSLVRDSQYE